jgi:hydroxymethylbilane synthase
VAPKSKRDPQVIRIGTRASELALRQARLVEAALLARGLKSELVTFKTTGDKKLDQPLTEIGAKGLFTRELEVALSKKKIDCAVHSLKDLPTESPDGLEIIARLEREDPRDVLVVNRLTGAENLEDLPAGSRVGTSSLRRRAQLMAKRPDLEVVELRGNVDTRLRKRSERGLDGVVLAACGLDRLELAHEIGFRIDVEEMLPETGQGFLALQARSEDAAALAVVGEAEAARILVAERSCAALLGGGCRAPVATHAVTQPDGRLWLRAWLALPDGSVVVVAEGRGLEPLALAGEVAGAALGRGGEAVVAAVRA